MGKNWCIKSWHLKVSTLIVEIKNKISNRLSQEVQEHGGWRDRRVSINFYKKNNNFQLSHEIKFIEVTLSNSLQSLLNCANCAPSCLRVLPIINKYLCVLTLINTSIEANIHPAIFMRLSPSVLFWARTVYQLHNNK